MVLSYPDPEEKIRNYLVQSRSFIISVIAELVPFLFQEYS